jgi:hypothetical protein
MTREQALSVWALLAAAAPGQALPVSALEIRAELIADLDFADTRDAAVRLARCVKWLPSVAELREAVHAPALPEAGEAWGEVCRVVHRLGWTTPPTETDFSDPLILRAVQALGTWTDFCAGDEAINRAHFLKIFPALAERARRHAIAGPPPRTALPATTAAAAPDRLDRPSDDNRELWR